MSSDAPEDTDQRGPEPADERPLLSVPVAFALGLVFLVVTLGGGFWLVRARTQPSADEGVPLATVWARQGTVFPTPTVARPATAAATPAPAVTQAPGQQPVAALATPMATARTQPIATGAGSTAEQSTPTTGVASAPANPQPTQASVPASAQASATSEPTLAPAPEVVDIGAGCLAEAGVPEGPAKEVADAYLHYFEVSGQALYQLDSTQLDEVTAGPELTTLRKNIEDDRAAGRAVRTDVEHYCVVLHVDGDNADVGDDYRDSSVYVDPVSRQVLPGEHVPVSPDVAPEFKVIYQLQRIDGLWKVVDGATVS